MYSFFASRKRWNEWMDGFSLASIGGIVLLHLLPEAIESKGMIAFGFILIGLFLPGLLDTFLSKKFHTNGNIFLLLGMYLHTIIESAALGSIQGEGLQALGLAIVLHRFPVGLLLFSFLLKDRGKKYAVGSIIGLTLVSSLGFLLGSRLQFLVPDTYSVYLEIFVSASLLHVAFDNRHSFHVLQDKGTEHVHTESCNHPTHTHFLSPPKKISFPPIPKSQSLWKENKYFHHIYASIGSIFGIAMVSYIMGQPNLSRIGGTYSLSFLDTFFTMALESAPALLIAYVFSGLIKGFLPNSGIHWLGKGGSVLQSLKGVLFGLPLPICSCGVLPIYESLFKRGVPITASIGFLIATPELGLDALLLSIPLLGKELTLVRLLVAFLVAVIVSLFMGKMILHKKEIFIPKTPEADTSSFKEKIKNGFAFGLVELFDHTIPWILLGLFLSAVIEPVFEYGFFNSIPEFLQVPFFALVGIPFYVCATGATPLAAIAIHKGISSGAAIAFLISGPATNLTTFGILSRLHSKKFAVTFGFLVTFLAIGFGLLVNYFQIQGVEGLHGMTTGEALVSKYISLCVLSILFVLSLFRQGPRGVINQLIAPIH
jgi:uncharacterized membrane protein YraQ (UPF0718 family)